MSLVKDTMLDNIKGLYRDDTFFSNPFESLSKKSRFQEKTNNFLACVLDAGNLYYKSKICIFEVENYIRKILYDCQSVPISSYSRFSKTYAVVKKYHFWP